MTEATLPPLLALPVELIHHILTFVPSLSVAAVSGTCHWLRQHALSEQLWQSLVNEKVPYHLTTPSPLPSFRELYIAHHPYWFLPEYRLWYADSDPNGKLLLARYDARRGCIEAYSIVAEPGPHTFEIWQHNPNVVIHGFNPRVQLDLNQPVLKLDVGSPRAKFNPPPRRQRRSMSNWFRPDQSFQEEDDDQDVEETPRLAREVLMDTGAPPGLYASFMLARDHPAEITGPGTAVWPPLRVPALSRTRNTSLGSFAASGHRPKRNDEVSQHTFRIRKWVEFSHRQTTGIMTTLGSAEDRLYAAIEHGFSPQALLRGIGGQSVRMGEDVATYGTLPPACYTPTARKPWRGIWCGDYGPHGCEFLVMLQPDEGEESPLPQGMARLHDWLTTGTRAQGSSSPSDGHGNTDLEAHSAMEEVYGSTMQPTPDQESGDGADHEYSGRIEAVKLTGDPNIPRGEYTFIAPDISDSGLIRISEDDTFRGARVVRSAGHIADSGFVNGKLFK